MARGCHHHGCVRPWWSSHVTAGTPAWRLVCLGPTKLGAALRTGAAIMRRSWAVASLVLALLAAIARGVPTQPGAALAPPGGEPANSAATSATSEPASVHSDFALYRGEGLPLRVISLNAVSSPDSTPAVHQTCTSHDVYLAVAQTMAIEATHFNNLTARQAREELASSDRTTQIIVLVLIGIVSLGLLTLGSVFLISALVFTLFLVVFWFVFGVADNITYDSSLAPNVSMCVMPFVIAILCGIAFAVVCLILVQKIKWLSFFMLGACTGGIATYIARGIIVSTSPTIAADPAFRWFWVSVPIVAIACGLIASWLKESIFIVATVIVGSYGVAVFVCGLVAVCTGVPLGSFSFVGIMVGSAAIGSVIQYAIKQREKPELASGNEDYMTWPPNKS